MAYLGNSPTSVPLTSADILDGTITLADLSATGTASSSTFLRGDNAWASAGATAGQVIQVLTATDQTERVTTSTSFVTASNTLSVSITPSAVANKILILVSSNLYGADDVSFYTVFRGSTDLGAASNKGFKSVRSDYGERGSLGINYLDSPSTTSATTYEVRIRSTTTGNTFLNFNSSKGSITLLEIKG